MALPIVTPARSCSSSFSSMPDARHASAAAINASCANRSKSGSSASLNSALASIGGASAATCAIYPDASKRLIRPTPLRPSTTRLQNAGTPTPSADTAPSPVIATLRTSVSFLGSGGGAAPADRAPGAARGTSRLTRARGDQGPKTIHDLADRLHRMRRVVRHDDFELVLESEEQIGRIERIDPQLLERARHRHARLVELFLFRHDRDDLLFERIGHDPFLLGMDAMQRPRSY